MAVCIIWSRSGYIYLTSRVQPDISDLQSATWGLFIDGNLNVLSQALTGSLTPNEAGILHSSLLAL